MPEIVVETIKDNNETYNDVYDRLRKMINEERKALVGKDGCGRVYSVDPAIQEIGNRYICRWKYKQYPPT